MRPRYSIGDDKMKKSKKALLTAAMLTSAVSFTSCEPSGSKVQDVYGPPVVQEDTTYDPAMDKPQTEYEAPIYEEETTEQTTVNLTTTTAEPTTKYDPSQYTVPAIYGPPPVDDETVTDELPTEQYDPSDDFIAVVYGPPGAT